MRGALSWHGGLWPPVLTGGRPPPLGPGLCPQSGLGVQLIPLKTKGSLPAREIPASKTLSLPKAGQPQLRMHGDISLGPEAAELTRDPCPSALHHLYYNNNNNNNTIQF